jgi:hypothetical protein
MTTETTATEQTIQQSVEQFVKENNMEAIVERIVKQEERFIELARNKDSIYTRLQEERETSRANRDSVRNKFREMLDGDKDAIIEMDLEDINNLLQEIGASRIVFTYSVDVTVTATITGIEADNEDDAMAKAIEQMELRVNTNELGEDANVENEDYEADNAQEEDN